MMKKNILFFILFTAISYSAQIKWMTVEEAVAAQKIAPKKIFISFYADWCTLCKKMDKTTYNHSVIAQYINENYYPVKFNSEGNDTITLFNRSFINENYQTDKKKNSLHDFTKYMNVNAVPSIVFLDEKNNPITILQGSLTAKELEPYIPFISNNDYKKINSREQWENYQRKFKSKIKD